MDAKRVLAGVRRRAGRARRTAAARATAARSSAALRRDLNAGAARLASLQGSSNSLHLGAGSDLRVGWVNVDMWPIPVTPVPGALAVTHDLRRGLMVPDGSCSRIYSSHFFEHLPWDSGEDMLAQCLRALAPGGQFRMCVPDFELLAQKYIAGDEEFFATLMPRTQFPVHSRPGAESIIDWMNYSIYQDGEHVVMFDRAKALRLLASIGFTDVRVTDFDPEWDFDMPVRRGLSMYVQASR